jgi:hypothetical protein
LRVQRFCIGSVPHDLCSLTAHLHFTAAVQALDFAFLAVVDVSCLRSTLLLCGRAEEALAAAALTDSSADMSGKLDLGPRVSRKKDFLPPISAAILKGGPWERHLGRLQAGESEAFGPVVHECGPKGCILRRMPSTRSTAD